ncbi:MAG TPA: glutamate 5-kinase, partial [Candidatus Bathyarchaeota archaeon]|nr:glutamate 5-kinase [Candidatus Bathyarchaeota archaeon]
MEGYKERKAIIDKTKRMVVKVGTGVLTKENGELDIERIKKLVKQIVDIKKSGREIVLVTSGAIAGGMGRIGLRGRPDELPIHLKQTCAAIGQIELMKQYGMEFSKYGIIPAQVLITEEDLQNEEKYRNLWTTLSTLIAMG